jgi:hypothetical protein
MNIPQRLRHAPWAIIVAVAGVVLALAAGGLYVYRQSAPTSAARAQATPEETVREFLSAVFLAKDPQRVRAVVCSSWDPDNAITRTTAAVDKTAKVSWDEVVVVSSTDGRASVKARLGLRLPDDIQPSVHQDWRFSLVDENGWRVCEARPFIP